MKKEKIISKIGLNNLLNYIIENNIEVNFGLGYIFFKVNNKTIEYKFKVYNKSLAMECIKLVKPIVEMDFKEDGNKIENITYKNYTSAREVFISDYYKVSYPFNNAQIYFETNSGVYSTDRYWNIIEKTIKELVLNKDIKNLNKLLNKKYETNETFSTMILDLKKNNIK